MLPLYSAVLSSDGLFADLIDLRGLYGAGCLRLTVNRGSVRLSAGAAPDALDVIGDYSVGVSEVSIPLTRWVKVERLTGNSSTILVEILPHTADKRNVTATLSDVGVGKNPGPLTIADDAGRVVLGVDYKGGVVPAGIDKSLQDVGVSKDILLASRYALEGNAAAAKLHYHKARHRHKAPFFFNRQIADHRNAGDGVSTALQRMPAACLLTRDGNIAEVLMMWEQIAQPNAGADTKGVRLVQCILTVDLAKKTITPGPISVFSTEGTWAAGATGMVSGPQLCVTRTGRVVCVYIKGVRLPGTALHIYRRYADGRNADGSLAWSAEAKIFDASTSFPDWGPSFLATGSGGRILRLASGRLLSTLWTSLDSATGKFRSIYSDDNGLNWAAGTSYNAPEYGNENSIALMSDGTVVMSMRSETQLYDLRATSTDGITWTYTGVNTNWNATNCARSTHECGNATDQWPEALLWSAPTSATLGSRTRHAIRVSYDAGLTYQHEYFPANPAARIGYTSLISLDRLASSKIARDDEFYLLAYEWGFNDYASVGVTVFNLAEVFRG